MNAREYNGVLMKLRTECRKYQTETVDVIHIDNLKVALSNSKWNRTIICTTYGFRKLTQIGYFKPKDKFEFSDFFNFKLPNLTVQINHYVLFKKYRKSGMKYHMTRVLLTSGIITLLISFYLYWFNAVGIGNISYSRTGNRPMDTDNTINWFQTLIIGLSLILSFISIKLYDKFIEKRK